jgi:hypothetical protein
VHPLSNLYHYLLGAGVTSTSQILSLDLLLLLLTTSGLLLARIHVSIEYLETQHTSPRTQVKGLYLNPNKTQHPRINSLLVHLGATGLRLNCHVGILVAVSSLSWGTHLSLLGHSPTENYPALSAFGGLELTSCSIQSSDIAHHHVAIGAIALVSSSLYTSTLRGLAHKLRTTSPTHSRNDTSA